MNVCIVLVPTVYWYKLYCLEQSVNDSKEDDEQDGGVQVSGLVTPEQDINEIQNIFQF